MTGKAIGLRIRRCAKYDERPGLALGALRMLTTSPLDGVITNVSQLVII